MNKSFLGVCLAWVCVLAAAGSAWARVSVRTIGNETEYRFRIDRLTFDSLTMDGRDFAQPRLQGVDEYAAITYRVGYPELPVIRFFTTGDVRPDLKFAGGIRIQGPAERAKPSQPPFLKVPGGRPPLVIDRAAYEQDAPWPSVSYEVKEVGSLRGVSQKLVTLYPVQYVPKTNEYVLRKEYVVRVREAVKVPDNRFRGNPGFAFVVGERFRSSASLSAYADMTRGRGFDVNLLYPAADPDAIRSELRGLYKSKNGNLAYALIVGDQEDVPGLNSTRISGVTDHYYRAIDQEEYGKDINGPDIGVGRIAVQSEEQLSAVLGKLAKYARGDFKDTAWLSRASFIATNDQWEIAEGSHNYVIGTHTTAAGYFGIFPEDPMPGGDRLYAITHSVPDKTVLGAMNEGRAIINYSGHGSTDSWAGPDVTQEDVRSLNHTDALPFVISNACVTGDFRESESFAETWQRHPRGAVTFWGSMDSTYWDEDDILERRMFDGIFQKKLRTFADITTHALSELWRQYGGDGKSEYYWETYVTFGDPSLELRLIGAR